MIFLSVRILFLTDLVPYGTTEVTFCLHSLTVFFMSWNQFPPHLKHFLLVELEFCVVEFLEIERVPEENFFLPLPLPFFESYFK